MWPTPRALARMTLPELRALLDRSLDQWRAGSPDDFTVFERPELAAIDLQRCPIVLLGTGNELAQPVIEHALSRLDVVGILDNYRAGGTIAGNRIERDSALVDLRTRHPELVAFDLAWTRAGHRYFEGLCRRAGVPVLSVLHVYRRIGIASPLPSLDRPTARTLAAIDRMLATLDTWADPTSHETLIRLVLYRLTFERSFLHAVDAGNLAMYVGTGLFELSDDEHFVDAGACSGDTIDELCRRVGNWYRRIDVLEADPARLPALHRSLVGKRDIHVHEALNVDAAVPPGVTVLKVDVESGQANVVRSATRTIRRDRPVLCIAAHHRPEDLADVPTLVRSLDADYALHLRHHSDFYWDTVVYAIPA